MAELIKNRTWEKILLVIILVMSGWVYLKDIQKVPMYVDEHEWVRRGMVLAEYLPYSFVLESKVHSSCFIDDWKRINLDMPIFGQYIYGLFIKLNYRTNLLNLMERVDYNQGVKPCGSFYDDDKWWIKYALMENQDVMIPSEYKEAYSIIVRARILSVIASILTLIIVYDIGRLLDSRKLGILSTIILAIHPIYRWYSILAMLEIIPLCFFMLSLWVYLKYLGMVRKKEVKVGIWSLFLGGFLGFAAASKLNGFGGYLIIGVAEISRLAYWRLKYHSLDNFRVKQSIKLLVCSGLVMIMIFIFLNPYFWHNPVNSFWEMLTQRVKIIENQTHIFPTLFNKMIHQRILGAANIIFWPKTISKSSGLGLLLVTVWGMVCFATSKFKSLIKKTFLIYLLGWVVLVLGYTVIGFQRYYMPLLPLFALTEGMGLLSIYEWLIKKIRYNRK